MTLIDNITNLANQSISLSLDDGSIASMQLIFNGTTERWMMNLSYGIFTSNGIGVCTHPNLTRQFINLIPFGLQIVSADMTDPFNVNDFQSGRVQMYLMTKADVLAVETEVFSLP